MKRGVVIAAAALATAATVAGCGTEGDELAEQTQPVFTSVTQAASAEAETSSASAATESSATQAKKPATKAEETTSAKESSTSASPSPSSSTAPNTGLNTGRYIDAAGRGEWVEEVSTPACDGRNILILDSIIDYGDRGDTINRIADLVMFADPSGKPRRFMAPGHCPSLRGQVDGNDIYPVYLDFGSDVDGMCAAKASQGGNGRVLSNRNEYVDPC